jgi:hypothetical protein
MTMTMTTTMKMSQDKKHCNKQQVSVSLPRLLSCDNAATKDSEAIEMETPDASASNILITFAKRATTAQSSE